jgi:sulfonate transport system substrate-binding protein
MNIKKLLVAVLTLSITAMTAGCARTEQKQTQVSANDTAKVTSKTLNIALQPSAAFVPLYVVKQNGWLEEALAKYGVKVNWTEFESGPPENESFAAGQQDIGVIGDVPTVSAIAAGQQNEIIGVAGYGEHAYALLIPANSSATSVADLKGKKIGTVVGSTAHNLTGKLLKNTGLDIKSDVQLVNLGVGDVKVALETGQVDAAAIWEPNITRLVDSGIAKILADGKGGVLRGENTIFGRKKYLEENPEIAKIFLEQYARGNKELRENTAKVTEQIAKSFSLEAKQLEKVIEKYDYSVSIKDEDIAALQDTESFLIGINAIKKKIGIEKFFNSKYAESANLNK